MIANLTYNCDPESLAEVKEEDFSEAFENRIYSRPLFRNARILVTFLPGKSGLVSVAGTELGADPVSEHEQFVSDAAERAFDFCICQLASRKS